MVLLPKGINRDAGFALTELMIVVAIIGIIAGIGAYYLQDMQKRYLAESQVKEVHADIMYARSRAALRNRIYFVTLTSSPSTCQITEDTNETGGNAPDSGDVALFSPAKSLKYPAVSDSDSWTGTMILDAQGIISDSSGALLATDPVHIRFNTSGVSPEYDCLVVGPTRINEGKWNETKKSVRLDNRGMTLIEMLFALVILLIIAVAMMQMSLTATHHNVRNLARDEGVGVAETRMNQLTAKPFDDSELAATAGTTESPLQRTIRMFTIEYTPTRTIKESSTGDTKQITVSVAWKFKGQQYNHAVTSLMRKP